MNENIDLNFFRQAYDSDEANKLKQDWEGSEGYLFWVEYFYERWEGREKEILKKCETLSSDEGARIKQRLTDLIRNISAEWSKHNDIRKISSLDLYQYMTRLEKDQDLMKTIEEIEKELDQKGV